MADSARVARLREAYAAILNGYRDLERLSRRELRTLREHGDVAKVNAILREKKSVLRGIGVWEEGVTGGREWRKKSRRSLPPAGCRDLLSLLDAISRTVESTVLLEAEIRSLRRDALRPASAARQVAGPDHFFLTRNRPLTSS
ncbi:MAG TPA: hypothetical protein VKU85_15250 [bacterium]|nr:hypothetical protein [bacterium]